MERKAMKQVLVIATLVAALAPAAVAQQSKYPPISEYLMERSEEVALAKSAAPPNVSRRATIKVLTAAGYRTVDAGDNGFVCMVLRGFAAPTYTPAAARELVYDPTIAAPICYDSTAVRMVLPYQELRAKLAMEGKTADEITKAVEAAYAAGEIPKQDRVAFGYMFSADQNVHPDAGAWHPHVMIFAPNYTNEMLGGNSREDMPRATEDAGTPFTVVAIPVDHALAVRARRPRPR
jgi:hypothetical protein